MDTLQAEVTRQRVENEKLRGQVREVSEELSAALIESNRMAVEVRRRKKEGAGTSDTAAGGSSDADSLEDVISRMRHALSAASPHARARHEPVAHPMRPLPAGGRPLRMSPRAPALRAPPVRGAG